ncbi:MAG: hypothetical protein RH948_14980 [Cyclobacteriaceae bacterium]
MKNHEEIDQLIRQALSEEESKFYDQLEEQNLPQMIGGLFEGKMRWLSIMTVAIMPILFVGAVFCIYYFFQANEIKEMIIWCSSALILWFAVGFLKLYHFMQMDKNSIIREIKRMELQLAMLNNKLSNK